jgi:hypothetical protein
MSKNIRRTALALLLTLLATGAAQALPRESRVTPALPEAGSLFAPLWSWLTELFAPAGLAGESRLTAVWGKEGAEMDPNGRPSNAGAEMDPNGVPQSFGATDPSDEGAEMDPNG